MKAIEDIAVERQRQISKEGWTAAHDDDHACGELATAAACYALGQGFHAAYDPDRDDEFFVNGGELWPWDIEWWKPKSRREDLVRAGALIVAEIERLDRIAEPKPQHTCGSQYVMRELPDPTGLACTTSVPGTQHASKD